MRDPDGSRRRYTSGMPFKTLVRASIAVSFVTALAFSQTTPVVTPVVQLQNLAHTTDSLDKTVPFYRDVLGLPVNGARDPLAQQPQKLDEDMSKFTATKGMSFRAATFRIPNAAFGFELTEFTGGSRKTVRPNIQDIGTATLALQVRDIEKVLAKVKASGAAIVTIGGAPVNPAGNPNSKLREIVVRDPDGFFVELQQPDPLPASAATSTGVPTAIMPPPTSASCISLPRRATRRRPSTSVRTPAAASAENSPSECPAMQLASPGSTSDQPARLAQ